MEAEKRIMTELSPDEDPAAEKKYDDNDSAAPAAKKSKTDESGTKRIPKRIEHVNDEVMEFLIYLLYREPCLCNPSHQYYTNNKRKDEACQRLADEMNEEYGFEDAYTIEDVKANIEIMRKYYREYREKRLRIFEKNENLPRAEKWWCDLNRLLLDETNIELTSSTKRKSKTKMDKFIAKYLKAEDSCPQTDDDSDS